MNTKHIFTSDQLKLINNVKHKCILSDPTVEQHLLHRKEFLEDTKYTFKCLCSWTEDGLYKSLFFM